MFSVILVPLDGAATAEQALPLALSLANRAQAAVHLVHVRSAKKEEHADQAYLDGIAARIRASHSGPIETAVLEGPVADTLVAHSQSVAADLIVMTTHGRGPLSRLFVGSVADEVIRRAPAPVLVLRPTAVSVSLDAQWCPKHVLVALDASALSETALPPAQAIAKLMSADLTLLRIAEPIPALTPDGVLAQQAMVDATLLDEIKDQARTYVERIAARLRQENIAATGAIVVDDRPASAILDECENFDLLVLATHARSGLSRALLGSVADEVVRGAVKPVLVVRAHDQRPGA